MLTYAQSDCLINRIIQAQAPHLKYHILHSRMQIFSRGWKIDVKQKPFYLDFFPEYDYSRIVILESYCARCWFESDSGVKDTFDVYFFPMVAKPS